MPELPEVEVLARHLRPLLRGKVVLAADIRRERLIRPTSVAEFKRVLAGSRFIDVTRRGKNLIFKLRTPTRREPCLLVGHLGMTGRMYLLPLQTPLPKHTSVVLRFQRDQFVFEDPRTFGRLTFETNGLNDLGPEPLGQEFTAVNFGRQLARSSQAVKVKLLDQTVVAGVGNIYASEALFRARISPSRRSDQLSAQEVKRLRAAVRKTLSRAIKFGSKAQLDYAGSKNGDRLFYFGQAPEASPVAPERFLVYDRAGKPCVDCGRPIRRIVQAARSTFFCPACQPSGKSV